MQFELSFFVPLIARNQTNSTYILILMYIHKCRDLLVGGDLGVAVEGGYGCLSITGFEPWTSRFKVDRSTEYGTGRLLA